jgi:hypothetical protein
MSSKFLRNVENMREYINDDLYCFVQDNDFYSDVIKITKLGDTVSLKIVDSHLFVMYQNDTQKFKLSDNILIDPKFILCDSCDTISILSALKTHNKTKIDDLTNKLGILLKNMIIMENEINHF